MLIVVAFFEVDTSSQSDEAEHIQATCGSCGALREAAFDPSVSRRANELYHRLRIQIELLGDNDPKLWEEALRFVRMEPGTFECERLTTNEQELVREWAIRACVALYIRLDEARRAEFRKEFLQVAQGLPTAVLKGLRRIVAERVSESAELLGCLLSDIDLLAPPPTLKD